MTCATEAGCGLEMARVTVVKDRNGPGARQTEEGYFVLHRIGGGSVSRFCKSVMRRSMSSNVWEGRWLTCETHDLQIEDRHYSVRITYSTDDRQDVLVQVGESGE